MKVFKSSIWAQLFFIIYLIFHIVVANADENAFGYRIFIMQEKLAHRGNVLAQYKLGTLYEFGISVEPNTDEAINWYKKASEKGSKAAKDRLVYLDIKKNGYTQTTQSEWLDRIVSEARIGDVHSLIILGQLYHQGIAVDKNLEKAQFMLRKASSKGHTEVDLEIEEINRKLTQMSDAEKIKKEESGPVEQKPEVSKKTKQKTKKTPTIKKAVAKKPVKKAKTEESKENKRKKYEEALRKQREEQLILDKQQQWSEAE